jgi:hypothetical protein
VAWAVAAAWAVVEVQVGAEVQAAVGVRGDNPLGAPHVNGCSVTMGEAIPALPRGAL